jgi:hypothetical protein
MWYSYLEKNLFLDIFSTNIDVLVPSLYQCAETGSKEIFWILFQLLPHLRFNLFVISETFAMFLDLVVNSFTRQTLPTVNRKHFLMNILCIESLCPQETHNRTLLFCSTLLKHGRHFDYSKQPLNICMRVCYLDSHEAGLCCYLVIHIENLLHQLQLFYFHLWPIYWLISVIK